MVVHFTNYWCENSARLNKIQQELPTATKFESDDDVIGVMAALKSWGTEAAYLKAFPCIFWLMLCYSTQKHDSPLHEDFTLFFKRFKMRPFTKVSELRPFVEDWWRRLAAASPARVHSLLRPDSLRDRMLQKHLKTNHSSNDSTDIPGIQTIMDRSTEDETCWSVCRHSHWWQYALWTDAQAFNKPDI